MASVSKWPCTILGTPLVGARRWRAQIAVELAAQGAVVAVNYSSSKKGADDVVAKTRAKYIEACEKLTGEAFAWK